MFARLFLRWTLASVCAVLGFIPLAFCLLKLLLTPETWGGIIFGLFMFSIAHFLVGRSLAKTSVLP
jgi:hypothetical protein